MIFKAWFKTWISTHHEKHVIETLWSHSGEFESEKNLKKSKNSNQVTCSGKDMDIITNNIRANKGK